MKFKEIVNKPDQVCVLDEDNKWVPITMPYLGVTYDQVIKQIPEILECDVSPVSTITMVCVNYRIKRSSIIVNTTLKFSKPDGSVVSILGKPSEL